MDININIKPDELLSDLPELIRDIPPYAWCAIICIVLIVKLPEIIDSIAVLVLVQTTKIKDVQIVSKNYI